MTVRFRNVLDAIPLYRPGGCPDEQGGTTAIKLSSNESPWTPPQSITNAIEKACQNLNRYPDFYKEILTEKLADYYNLAREQIAIDNGSGTLLQNFVRIVANQGDEVIFGTPSFAAYEIDVLLAGAQPIKIPLDQTFTYDLKAIEAALTKKTRLIFICNPNNPTGSFLTTAKLAAFLEAIPPDILVVIDEAYHEFVTEEDQNESLKLLAAFDNVALLRTFSKAFGLAGMRIGYALTKPDIVDALNKTVAEFSVSTPAQAAACACLEPEALHIMKQRVSDITSSRFIFQQLLTQANRSFVPSQSNFIMLPQDSMTGFTLLEQRGVICRPFSNPEGIRITIGTQQDMKVVAETMGLSWPNQ